MRRCRGREKGGEEVKGASVERRDLRVKGSNSDARKSLHRV